MTTTKSDCGCTGTTSAGAGSAARSSASTAASAARSAAFAAQAATVGSGGTVVLDGFRALNPVDGLFLRAEHLAGIQDYARALTAALATAAGPGVVHGLGVTLAEDGLEVSPGLAVTAHGQLLLLTTTVRIPLDGEHVPARPTNGFWRVELHPASGSSGSAPVYGSLCNDGCSDSGGGAVIQPWRDEGVGIVLATDSLPGLDAVALYRRTNWLASTYFERERASGQPWLVPSGAGAGVDPLRSRDWSDATPLPGEEGVPLALVQLVDSTYRLDVWAARRLVDGPLSQAAWRSRLAIRPWSLFLAQVLQFEAEVTGLAAMLDVGAAQQWSRIREVLEKTQSLIGGLSPRDPIRTRGPFQELERAVELAAEDPVTTPDPTLPPREPPLGELPPAGYLQVDGGAKRLESALAAFFGEHVDLRLRRLRADQVPDEVLAAQSRDRIPLDPVAGTRPQVDVLIPAEPADKAELHTTAYDWVAFVRRGPEAGAREPEVPTEQVAVLLYFCEAPEQVAAGFREEDLKEAMQNQIGSLTYPRDSWAYPGGELAAEVLKNTPYGRAEALVGLTTGADAALAATRAGLFGTSLDSGAPLPVHAYREQPVDAIVVLAPYQIG